ncbi:MAG: hypothetical protein COU07_02525 [Candidatus Harrisonbacteria bacterium CG10_big_fil_rev_8_21_14_0_10_40_38]|uniref:DUF721 domain-containing protein n=1 Tax=Candidatus Harrisonbacteria bacterium CG10_big_fil_rev_8_21_14_0_10_40_38 TaxID=1974583 RepID=A0A2H0URX5_9BACT|nr:MAG: hypothetical protein COU07_02525 [Candidatus Harrisonbacteria bacterium CG10_big_fil_rev_8_21_14_0_10_40_38]
MDGIGKYLKRFKTLSNPQKTVAEELNAVLKEKGIPEVKLSFRDGVVYLKTHSVIKSEILLNQENILLSLNSRLEKRDIRVTRIV